MTHEPDGQLASLRRRVEGLREDARRKPHLRFTLETMIEQLEREAHMLEQSAGGRAERAI